MLIKDVFPLARGTVLAGGDPDPALQGVPDDELRALQGRELTVLRKGGESVQVSVIEAKVVRSISDQRNVMLAVSTEYGFSKDDIGGTVTWSA